MRVRAGSIYRFNPNGWDRIFPCTLSLNTMPKAGDIVRVVNLPGAPKANTMGQCYIADPNSGKFLCMVSTGSLERIK